jgi:hypothetical protein
MQAYWNNPENKYFILTLIHEEGEGFPPVRTPDDFPDLGALDYEDKLGIPLPIALAAEWVWLGAPRSYAATWPARFFETIQPNQNLSTVVWKVVNVACIIMRDKGQDWPLFGEHLLAMIASAPMS